jgi:cation transport regulator ChaC
MKNMRSEVLLAAEAHFVGHIEKHRANAEILATNAAGVGNNGDVLEELEKELAEVADYHDKLEMLYTYMGLDDVQLEAGRIPILGKRGQE